MNLFLITGILLNSVPYIVHRFVYELPNKVRIPLMFLGIVLIIVGLVQSGKIHT